MLLSQKCQYALRAAFDLARHYGQGPVRIADIAEAQAIPKRFLEVILGQLKQGGFVASHRGNEGGYTLERDPNSITVGDIIRFVEGPIGPVGCMAGESKENCPLRGQCVFMPMWEKVRQQVEDVYEKTSLQDLVEKERANEWSYAPSYDI
jgi:Rrf2 family cysteine metabolism transcriptional repressor